MKKLATILIAFLFAIVTYGQRGQVAEITPDTLTEVETEYFVIGPIGVAWESLTIQAYHEELGGISDGTGILEGSVDGDNYVTIQDDTGIMDSYPNDSVTISDGATYLWIIKDVPFNYLRYAATGTANDTTLVSVGWQYKEGK